MNDDMSTESVEAALAMPQNQQQQVGASSLAPTMQQPASPASLAPTAAAATPGATSGGAIGDVLDRLNPASTARIPNARAVFDSVIAAPTRGSRAMASLRDSVSARLNQVQQQAAPQPPAPAPQAQDERQPAEQAPRVRPAEPASPIRMYTPSGGGSAYPTYERKGRNVIIDGSVDVNDPVAVRNSIDATNSILDMIDETYAMEV